MTARILITRRLPDRVLEMAHTLGEVVVDEERAAYGPRDAGAALGEYDAIVPTLGDAFTEAAFAGGPHRTKILANFGAGFGHIDVEAAARAGIVVSNTPGAVTEATADIALTLMLMSCRRASEGESLLRSGKWTGWTPTQLLGLHMSGKTLGVIGMGRIGRSVAARAHHGFGMDIAFWNRSPDRDAGVPARQLGRIEEVMSAADVVVIALAAGPGMTGIIGADQIAAMRPHAHLVNIARGELVDEGALIAALEGGWIAGAGLDVYETEPDVPAALRRLPNVSLLPHLGTAALEVREAMGMMALDNVRAALEGREPPNRVA
ncbi:D-glycerate dehydrogenase [Roseicyclus sp. F158]|uniref:D-glycerate dehydrogenase n=1 Tax=Tropicimonas omnivorans TaxID=3075590 RepID=A0ABU3DDI4_9RHOB|nr:D-glycerate dehydrogenase [Roseicyclus sp. F158]MDT0681752.1 D-glycerate dehydrogenase [Roseicyclus sp. F158]